MPLCSGAKGAQQILGTVVKSIVGSDRWSGYTWLDPQRAQQRCAVTKPHVPADAIWQVISDLHAAGQYFSGVVNCTVEGEGVSALRRLTSADGTTRSSSTWMRWTRPPTGSATP